MANRRPPPAPPNYPPPEAQPGAMRNALSLGLPITVVVVLLWTLALAVWTFSGRFSTSESTVKEVTNRMDALEKKHSDDVQELKHTIEDMHNDLSRRVSDDHDTITGMKSDIAAQSHNIDVMQRDEAGRPIKIETGPPDNSGKKQ